jgi:hypothetical protein
VSTDLYVSLVVDNQDPGTLDGLTGSLSATICGYPGVGVRTPVQPPPTGILTLGTLDGNGVCQVDWGLTFHPSYTSPPYTTDSHGNYPPRDPVTNQVIPAASMQGDRVAGNCVK